MKMTILLEGNHTVEAHIPGELNEELKSTIKKMLLQKHLADPEDRVLYIGNGPQAIMLDTHYIVGFIIDKE